jgi:hypothetical protein
MSIKDMTATDHVIAVGKAVLNLDPTSTTLGIGGFLSSLVGDYVPTSRQKAAEAAVKRLGRRSTNSKAGSNPRLSTKKNLPSCSTSSRPSRARPIASRS